MNPTLAFFVGLLIGWLVEWVIDWIYWRRRQAALQDENTTLRSQLSVLQNEKMRLETQVASLQQENREVRSKLLEVSNQAKDNLEEIKGIGPELARLLNQNGIKTFHDLALVTPKDLRGLLGENVQRLADEVDIIKQAWIKAGLMTKADDLEVIDGIGPVIARTLNEACIFTFSELAALTPDQLRAIVGDRIQRLADEDDILNQAKNLAKA